MTIKIYVANLSEYNAGNLKGAWFTLPVDTQEIFETIFTASELDENGQPHGDWAIHDYEAPFRIGEYENLDKLNEWAEVLDGCNEDTDVIRAILENFYNVEEGFAVLENGSYTVYHDCSTMEDVAYEVVEAGGLLDGVSEEIKRYFDYEAYGRDLEIQGTFLEAGNRMYVEIH
jgi:antirestriction protein